MKLKINILLTILALNLILSSCNKVVTVPPPTTALTGASVFSTDATAISMLTGIYANMSNNALDNGIKSISVYCGLSADELAVYSNASPDYFIYYQNALSSVNTGYSDLWSTIYPLIYRANSAIEGLSAASSLTPAIRQQLTGEAKFVRAFCYFYLVNLYGPVPLALSPDYSVNANLPRSSIDLVYQQIVKDLIDAQGLLSDKFLDATLLASSPDRVRPSKWAATALLARTYLYMKDYTNAEVQASKIINSSLFDLGTISNTFLRSSSGNNEAIWQLQPVNNGQNTPDAWMLILPPTGPDFPHPFYVSNSLLATFEPSDLRKSNWTTTINAGGTTYTYSSKYKSATLNAPVTEHEVVFRLAELYLIRAEAEANGAGGGLSSAISDLNKIRSRAGLSGYSGVPTDRDAIIKAIIHERRVELFLEWGHRWLDLKRTGTVNAVMKVETGLKGGTWNANSSLYPIPFNDLLRDRNMTQNPGY